LPVRGSLESVLELLEVLAVVQLLGSAGIKVTQVVEVLLTQRLTLGVIHVLSSEGVVDNLKSFPVTFGLEDVVHDLLSGAIAVSHDPSVEADEPNFLEEHLDVTGRVIVNHLGDVVDTDALVTFSSLTAFVVRLAEEGND